MLNEYTTTQTDSPSSSKWAQVASNEIDLSFHFVFSIVIAKNVVSEKRVDEGGFNICALKGFSSTKKKN